MKHTDRNVLRKIVSMILTLTLVFGSASDLVSGIASAIAEGVATPTDLMPVYPEETVPDEPAEAESSGEQGSASQEDPLEETPVGFANEPIAEESGSVGFSDDSIIGEAEPVGSQEEAASEEPASVGTAEGLNSEQPSESAEELIGVSASLLSAAQETSVEASSVVEYAAQEAEQEAAPEEATQEEQTEESIQEGRAEEAEQEEESGDAAQEEGAEEVPEEVAQEEQAEEAIQGEQSEEAAQSEQPAEVDQAGTEAVYQASEFTASAAAVLKGESETKVSALQQMIDKKLDSLKEKKGRVTITISQDTEYEGDVSIEKKEGTAYAEDFGVDLVAEGSGDDRLQGDGSVKVKGNIIINGIPVRLAGIAVGGAISVKGAKVEIYGTKKDDTVNVTAAGGADVTVMTGDGDDEVTGTAQDKDTALTVNTGEGNDTLTAAVKNNAALTVETGAGDDTLDVSVYTGAKADLSTGEGSDKVRLKDQSTGDVKAETGAENDQVTVEVGGNIKTLTVNTGDGDDRVDLGNPDSAAVSNPTGKVQVSLGSGNDEAIVDVSLSEVTESVNIEGGEDSDRLILTGVLNEETDEDKRVTGTAENLKLAGGKRTLTVTSKEIEDYADSLENKKTIRLTPGTTGAMTLSVKNPFTNYLLNVPSNKLSNITITAEDGRKLLLSSVIIDTESTEGDGNRLVIGEGKTVSVTGLRLVLKGQNIEVNGTIMADQVEMLAQDGTGLYQTGIGDLYNAVADGNSIERIADTATDLLLDLFNVDNGATITIGEKAAVYSAGDVILLAKVEQKGGIITFLPNVNVVNVKVAKAGIDIAGKVYAGYDFAAKKVSNTRGNVRAEASVETTMGYNEEDKIEAGLPLAVNVASLETYVNVRKGAIVEAAKDVTLSSNTELKAAARADSGLAGLPAAVAVSVLLTDAHTNVDGQVTARDGSVQALANGITAGRTIAEKGEGQKMISGGYAGVAVALQDVSAKINRTAAVNAGKGVTVKSVARETVNTEATSGAVDLGEESAGSVSDTESFYNNLAGDGDDDDESSGTSLILKALKGLWPVIREKISSETAQEKLDKAMKKLVTSNKSVKLDDNAGKKGDVTLDLDDAARGDQAITGKITVKPWAGYRVKSIKWRGYNPGEATYITGEVTSGGAFTLRAQNVVFFVEYEEDASYNEVNDSPADLFDEGNQPAAEDTDIGQLLDNTAYSINDTDDEEEEEEKEEATPAQPEPSPAPAATLELKLEGDGGAVLTYETDPQDGTKSLSKVAQGQKFRLVPNPQKGKALKQGGMKVTYYVKENGKEVSKTEIVNPDGQNRYWFTVPENAMAEKGIAVKATYVDDGNPDTEADETQTQLTGVVAVSVTRNDNEALVDAGAQVISGGKTEVIADASTNVSSAADGTSMTKEVAENKKETDEDAIKRPEAKAYTGFDATGREFALLLDATVNGQVSCEKGKTDYLYSFTATPAESYGVVSAILEYYEDGQRKTKELTVKDGKYALNLLDIAMDKGSAARVSFAFGRENADGETVSFQEGKAIIPNAIRIAYNALKDENNLSGYKYAGKIYYKEAKADQNGTITAYIFDVSPEEDEGYVLDGKPKASWKDVTGETKEAELKQQEDGSWALDPADVPEGVLITVTGSFKEDFHDFRVDTEKTSNGALVLHDEKLKQADAPKITVKPNPGYSIFDLAVTYTEGGRKKTIRLSDTDSKIKKAKDKEGKELDNVYTFEVPGLTASTDITVQADFKLKTIGLYSANGDTAKDYVLSEKNVAPGDRVTISPSDELKKQGKKVSSYLVKNEAGGTLFSGKGDTFSIPRVMKDGAKMTVIATVSDKDVALTEAKLENGAIKPDVPRADQGEKVTVTIAPASNFKAKTGTVKAVLKADDGTYTEEIYMSRQSDTTYSFIMPEGIKNPHAVKVTFVGEFEPGVANSSEVKTSIGAGIAVTVSSGENRADVKGAVTSGGDVTVKATQDGGVKTESKAGYSKGKIGIGGAVSVQVASLNSRALLHAGGAVTLNGVLTLESESKLNDTVNADASGNRQAEKTGVGAGVAVAVNGSDAYAALADGAKVAAKTAGGSLQGISITAKQKIEDIVSAKAGAAGGTAAVPVAAVDVIGSSAEAYLGKAQADALAVTDTAVSAANETTHTISADASATGKGAGVGAAIAVSVASDTARARMNQSVNGEQVTVASETVSELTETATASASGGKASGKKADGQANGLLDGAAKAAGRNGSKNVSSSKIDKAVKDRQKAQTSEGTVGVAGAVIVNVQEGSNRSEIMDGVNVTASGLVAVTAANRTEAKINANASTTNSDIGVGVGVGVNIVELNNIAALGNGEIRAAMLRVTAETKEKEPDTAKTVKMESVENTDGLAQQLGDAVAEYLNDLMKELGLDQLPEDLLGDLIGPVVTKATNSLIEATGLADVIGGGDWENKLETAKSRLSELASGLLNLPEKLAEPLMDALREAAELGDLSQEQLEGIGQTLKDEFTTQLLNRLTNSGKTVLNGVKDGMIEYLKDNVSDLMSAFSGGLKEGFDTILKGLKEELGKQVKKQAKSALKALLTDTWKETLTRLTGSVPGLSQQNVDAAVSAFADLKDAYQEKSVSGLLGNAADYAAETFRQNVFDYEAMLARFAGKDFGEEIGNALRAAAKEASVTLTNTLISKLSSAFVPSLEAEEKKATGHVISTDAISGTGARDVGVAGSVAITVLNAATKATLAESGGTVTVSGDTLVNAEELRSVRNAASAALDAKGKADTNKDAEKAANQDVGGGNDAKSVVSGTRAKLTVGPGGTAEILQGDRADDKPKMYVSLKDGYALPENQKATYTYADGNGAEVVGTIDIQKDAQGRWFVDPKSGELAKLDDKTDVAIEITPVEVLNTIAKPDTLTDGKVVLEEGAVTVAVEGREAENDTLSARVGETVKVIIAKGENRKVSQVGYSWKDAEGKQHDIEINTGKDAARTKEFSLVASNEKEYIYTFNMPEGAVTDVVVAFEAGEPEDAEDAKTASKDESGKRVGVGAAFSMIYGDTAVTADVGRRGISSGTLSVTAGSSHKENVASAAGTDPLSGDLDMDQTKKFSLDAAVSLNILDNAIQAGAKAGGAIRTNTGDLTVTAKEDSVTETVSSAFAVGSETAIGASVAVNIASTGVKANLASGAAVAGDAIISAASHSEDVTTALATAMGADIARTLAKIGEKAENIAEKANKVMDGSYIDSIGKKTGNGTAGKINEKLDQKKRGNGSGTSGAASTSTNVLRSLGVETQSENAGQEGTAEAEKLIKDKTGKDVSLGREENKSKWQAAAAVGVTVADHAAETMVGAITAGGRIAATAENTGNFNTQGTGASMSLAEHANSIAAGVAVSVNDNKAKVSAGGDLISNNRNDIAVTSKLTQNLDGQFAGKLAAQALSGSVAGKNSGVSIGGAVTVLVSEAESTVDIASGTAEAPRTLTGGVITVGATDKSKLAARSGGLSISKGSSVGMGIASTSIISGNTVTAQVGDYAKITAGDFNLKAEKLAVTRADYRSLIDLSYVITDSSAMSEDERKKADTGLIDIHKGEDEDSYKVEVNLSSEKLLSAMDGLNFLSSQNTYAEAIAGSLMTGTASDEKGTSNKSYLSLAGSFAVAVTNNSIRSRLGQGANVALTQSGNHTGAMSLQAENGNNARIIAGAISAAPAKASVGAAISVLIGTDSVVAETGANTTVKADGNISQNAESTGEIQAFTAAMGIAAGTKVDTAVGGAVNVIVNRNRSESILGNNVQWSAGADGRVSSRTAMDLITISGSASVTALSGVAAGGAVNVIYDQAKALTTLGDQNSLTAGKNLTVTSEVKDRTLSGTASLSAAIAMKNAGVGVANVIIGRSAASTGIGASAALTAATGDLKTTAKNDAWMLNASLALAGGGKTAVGAAFNVNVVDRIAKVAMADGTLKAGGNLMAQASGVDTDILAGLSVAAGVAGSGLSGNVVVLVESSEIGTEISKGMKAEAAGSAVMESYYQDRIIDVAGSIAASLSSSAVGATISVMVKNNKVKTVLADSDVTVKNALNAPVKNLAGKDVSGIFVGASAVETQAIGAAGIAVAGSSAVNGVVNVLVNSNEILADGSRATLSAEGEESTKRDAPEGLKVFVSDGVSEMEMTVDGYPWFKDPQGRRVNLAGLIEYPNVSVYRTLPSGERVKISRLDELLEDVLTVTGGGDISIIARDDTTQLLLAGGVSASFGSGVGAAVVTVVSGKDVRAEAYRASAAGNLSISAENQDEIDQLAISAGISGASAVQIGAAVQVLRSSAKAKAGGMGVALTSQAGNFSLTSQNDVDLYNIGAAVGIAGGSAVTPVGVVTYFQGESDARLRGGSRVELKKNGKNINIQATSDKEINLYSVGASIGSNAVSGAANVLISKDNASAVAESGTEMTTGGDVNIHANGDYKLRSASAALSAGANAVGVNAVVSVMKSNTLADLSGAVNGQTGKAKNMNVTSSAKRDVINAVANVSAGANGIGVSAFVLIAGTKMSQDAADMIAYGNSEDRSRKSGFDGKSFLDTMEKNGIESKYYRSSSRPVGIDLSGDMLESELSGNGHYESKETVGTTTGEGKDKKTTFDGASKYRSADFDDAGFNDEGAVKRGENLTPDDTADIAKARNMNTFTYQDVSKDAVIARIDESAVVNANSVTVAALQPVAADMLGATVGVGANGIGASVGVVMLRSNVIASSMGAIIGAAGGVTVSAKSVAGQLEGDTGAADRDATVLDLMSNNGDKNQSAEDKQGAIAKLKEKLNPSNRAIRTFALALGAGAVGGSASVSVILTDNVTEATLGGTVENAGGVNVHAEHDYGTVMAATGALAGGLYSGSASVAVAQANGAVRAAVARNANISANELNVSTKSTVGVDAAAVTVSGGLITVNAGVALAFNHLTQETGIGAGATVKAGKNVNVLAESTKNESNSYLLGVAVGGIGTTMNAAVSDMDAKVKTYIGEKGEGLGKTSVSAADLTVRNNISSSATPLVLSAAIGGIATGGNVLLAFNDSAAEAAVKNANIQSANLSVTSDLTATAESSLAALEVGALAIGLSVNYADINAENIAAVEDSEVNVTDDMKVLAGMDESNVSLASADTISGNIDLLNLGMNAAIARNRSKNYAILTGDEMIFVNDGLTVRGSGKPTAKASLNGLSVGAARIAATAVVSLNEADTRTKVALKNLNVGGKTYLGADQDAKTTADIKTGGGSVYNQQLTIAAAYGKTTTMIDAAVTGDAKLSGGIEAKNNAADGTASRITNQGFDIISAAAMAGLAYSQDLADTKVKLLGGNNRVNNQADIGTDYSFTGVADVSPSAGGVSVSLGDLALNLAIAKSTAYAGTEYASGGTTEILSDLNVVTNGTATTDAKINSTEITVKGASLGANLALSEMSAVQAATLRVGGSLTVSREVKVQSLHQDVISKAVIGTSGKKSGSSIEVSLFNKKTNVSSAWQNLDSTASILGQNTEGSTGKLDITTHALKVQAMKAADTSVGKAEARTDGAKEVTLVTAGNLSAKAVASENAGAVLRHVTVNAGQNIEINAITTGESNAVGFVPGKLATVNGGVSTVQAGIGSEAKRQGARVILEDGVNLTGHVVKIGSENNGNATATTEKATSYTLGSMNSSNQPTASWYETQVILGKGTEVTSKAGEDQGDDAGLEILSATNSKAVSKVDADSLGLVLNADTMKGENRIEEDNKILIGDNVKLDAGNILTIGARSTAVSDAKTVFNGKFSAIGKSKVNAKSTLNRNLTLQVGNHASLHAARNLNIENIVGQGDDIETHAKQVTKSGANFAKAEGRVDTAVDNKILIGAGAQITSGGNVEIAAINTGRKPNGNHAYGTRGDVDATGFNGDAAPDGYGILALNYAANVMINPDLGDRVKISADGGKVNIRATNRGLHTETHSDVRGDGIIGGIDAYATTNAVIRNSIWLDNADIYSLNGTGVYASSGSVEASKAKLNNYAYVDLDSLGYESPTAQIEGSVYNTVNTHNKDSVVVTGGAFDHQAYWNLDYALSVETNGIAWDRDHKYDNLGKNQKCDFHNNKASTGTFNLVDTDAILSGSLKKALAPLEDIQRMVDVRGDITRAPASKMDREAAEKLYVLDVEAVLSKDVRLEKDDLQDTWLWVNMETQMEVFLLPNATRLCATAGSKLQYVSEVYMDNSSIPVDIFTALTDYAVSSAIIPIGSTGSLNFRDGTLVLPDQANFRLNLNEISGAWMVRKMKEGFFQGIIGQQDRVNAFVQGKADLPEGALYTGLTEGDASQVGFMNETLYWLGKTPETVTDPNQTLIFLTEDRTKDRISAYRTTAAGLASGEKPVSVSMYMYRDSKNDRMGIEVYNVLFYDTPADSKSQYRVVSSVLMDRALEMPKSMHLTLRSFEIEGTEYSVYSIDGHFYILCDGTKGSVDLFDGAYQATFDGDTFESKYLLIEGIRDGNPQVTLKEGQTVWPEWQGENKAEDLEGRIYLRINDTWTEASSQSKR